MQSLIRPEGDRMWTNIARNAIGSFLFAYGIVGFFSLIYLISALD